MTEAFYSHPLFPNAGRMTCLCDLMRSTEECAQLFSHFQVLSCMPVTCCAGLFFTGAKWSRERIFWESTYFNSPCSARRFPRHSIWLTALPMFFLRWVFLQSIRLNRTQGNQNESILQFILIGLPYARTWGAQQFKCLEAYKNTDLQRKRAGGSAALLYRYMQWDVNCLAFHSCSLKNEPALRQHPSPIYSGLRITAVHFSCSDTAMHSREYPQVQTHSH